MNVKGDFGNDGERSVRSGNPLNNQGNPDPYNGDTEVKWIWIVVEGTVQLGREVV